MPETPQNQDLGGMAQKIRDVMDGKVQSTDLSNVFEPPPEDNATPQQSTVNPPLVKPSTYNSWGPST
jgi:hypothetical protein